MNICIVIYKYAVPLDDPCCYPLGPMYISSALKKLGHNVKVLNYNLWDYDFMSEIADQDRVMFTGFEEFFERIKYDAETCKALGIKTVVGGALATFLPEVMLKICDTVVTGEGDMVMDVALRKTGIVFGYTGVFNDLLPDYEGFGIDEYHRRHTGMKYMGVLATRGCPYSCTFCAQTCRYSIRPLQHVLEEIDGYIDKYGIEVVVFNDNTLNADKKYFEELISTLTVRNVKWGASIRLDIINDSIVESMANSGCHYLVVGIESFQQHRLDMMNKRLTVKSIVCGLDLLHKYGIDYHGNVLVGFEGEDMDDVNKELASIPSGYNVFPIRVRPFIGIKESCNSNLSDEDKKELDEMFENYVIASGKYLYPELPEVCV